MPHMLSCSHMLIMLYEGKCSQGVSSRSHVNIQTISCRPDFVSVSCKQGLNLRLTNCMRHVNILTSLYLTSWINSPISCSTALFSKICFVTWSKNTTNEKMNSINFQTIRFQNIMNTTSKQIIIKHLLYIIS